MPINKVNYGDRVLIDLTSDTVSADTLLKGYTAHDKSGNSITGTYEGSSGSGGTYEEYDGTFEGNAELVVEIPEIPITGKNISANMQVLNQGMVFYSLDNGVTWNDFYDLYNDGDYEDPVLTNVNQIKFKLITHSYNSNLWIASETLELYLVPEDIDIEAESENYILEQDIIDLEVFAALYEE